MYNEHLQESKKRFSVPQFMSLHPDRAIGDKNLSNRCFAVVFLQKNNQKNAL